MDRYRVYLVLVLLLFSSTAHADSMGQDINGNALWDDLEQVVQGSLDKPMWPVGYEIAQGLQDFTRVSGNNLSLATQAATKTQNGLLCLLALKGPKAGDFFSVLKRQITVHPVRANRFQNNEKIMVGTQLPYETDTSKWTDLCPQGIDPERVLSSYAP